MTLLFFFFLDECLRVHMSFFIVVVTGRPIACASDCGRGPFVLITNTTTCHYRETCDERWLEEQGRRRGEPGPEPAEPCNSWTGATRRKKKKKVGGEKNVICIERVITGARNTLPVPCPLLPRLVEELSRAHLVVGRCCHGSTICSPSGVGQTPRLVVKRTKQKPRSP